jgi:MFS family permease
MGAFWGLLPVYVLGTGVQAGAVGTTMSVAIVGGALLQWPLGRLSDRHDRRVALALVCAAAPPPACWPCWRSCRAASGWPRWR